MVDTAKVDEILKRHNSKRENIIAILLDCHVKETTGYGFLNVIRVVRRFDIVHTLNIVMGRRWANGRAFTR